MPNKIEQPAACQTYRRGEESSSTSRGEERSNRSSRIGEERSSKSISRRGEEWSSISRGEERSREK